MLSQSLDLQCRLVMNIRIYNRTLVRKLCDLKTNFTIDIYPDIICAEHINYLIDEPGSKTREVNLHSGLPRLCCSPEESSVVSNIIFKVSDLRKSSC